MRFRHDFEGDGRPAGPPMTDPRPLIDGRRREEFLGLIREGLGWALACSQLGIDPADLQRTLRACPEFRRALARVEQVRAENLYAVLYQAALEGDTTAARYLLARHDRRHRRRRRGDLGT